MSSLQDKTIALAGLFQATSLVQAIAMTGKADSRDLEVCLKSIIELDPVDLQAIYGQPANLTTGLQLIISQFGANNNKPDLDIARYAISLLHLERKLAKEPQMLSLITEGIKRANKQLEHFPLSHENIIANLAAIYSETVSLIPPKIMVSGDNQYLGDNHNANLIRALLLCGMRAAVLWHQLGGRRWQLLFQRRKLVVEAQRLLQT